MRLNDILAGMALASFLIGLIVGVVWLMAPSTPDQCSERVTYVGAWSTYVTCPARTTMHVEDGLVTCRCPEAP